MSTLMRTPASDGDGSNDGGRRRCSNINGSVVVVVVVLVDNCCDHVIQVVINCNATDCAVGAVDDVEGGQGVVGDDSRDTVVDDVANL